MAGASISDYYVGKSLVGNQPAAPEPSIALIDREFNALMEDLSELDKGLAELMARIQPVMQPGQEVGLAGSESAPKPVDSPSGVRYRIMKARDAVAGINGHLTGWRYRLEI